MPCWKRFIASWRARLAEARKRRFEGASILRRYRQVRDNAPVGTAPWKSLPKEAAAGLRRALKAHSEEFFLLWLAWIGSYRAWNLDRGFSSPVPPPEILVQGYRGTRLRFSRAEYEAAVLLS